MGMTIDEAIRYYENKNVVLTEEEALANTIAIEVMRKYQKMQGVLDKIRAEIKALTSNRGFLSCSVDYIHKEIDAVFDIYKEN